MRLANALGVDVDEICTSVPFSRDIQKEEIYPSVPEWLGSLDESRVKSYTKFSLYPLMMLYGSVAMSDVDNLLTSFYQLDDEARQEIIATIKLKLQFHRDPERAEQVKQIKKW